MSYRGESVEFEFVSADASTAAPIVLRASGDRTSRTLAADERFVLEQLNAHVVQSAVTPDLNITAVIFADTDEGGTLDAGDLMAVVGDGISHSSFAPNGMAGSLGVTPKVLASAAGQIYVSGSGYIMKG